MKRVLLTVLVLSIILVMAFPQEGECRLRKNFYSMLSDAKEVRTYVASVTDSSGEAGDMLGGIKKTLESALMARMSTNFIIVQDEKDADLVITCDITERIWRDSDPVDTPSLAGAVADAALVQDYGRIQAVFTVKRGEDNKVKSLSRLRKKRTILWQKKVSADITKSDMSEDASKPLLEERLVQIFIRKCFGKKAKV